MSRIIVSLYKYKPAVASTIRVVAYIKSFLKMGYEVVLVTTSEEAIELKGDKLKIVLFDEYKGGLSFRSKLINDIRLVKTTQAVYQEGDIVYTYQVPLMGFLYSKKWNVFYEETEVPMYTEETDLIHRLSNKLRMYTLKRAKGLIVISKALKEYYSENGIEDDKIMISNMTVDITRFEGLVKQSVPKYIAYCGGISNHKDGADVLIKAFAKVAQQINDLKLYIVGKFVQPEEEAYDKQLAVSLGIKDRVVFTGAIPSSEIPQLLKNADCLVLARPESKQAKYGFPTKLGEYLLTGNPVVVTAVGEIPLYLKDRQDAYLPKPGDVDDISSCIYEALTSANAKLVGLSGCKVAKENFNSEIETKKVLDFFSEKIKTNHV